MNDDELLRGYRAAGPPSDLRARIVAGSATALVERERPSLREWLPALATAALIAVLYVVATEIRVHVYTQVSESLGVDHLEVASP